MTLENEEQIIIPDENGEEHLFEVLYKFDVDETGASYIAVTPVGQTEGEDLEVFTFRYEEKPDDDDDIAIYHIESDEEWKLVDEMLHTLTSEELI
ncbi:DUF1292 domain-containing protein [Pseudalkalibacillus hwajinpoensis]|uniref:DUF1292 domain-containing protein n=1 Tax=Guptibacillus hwajinpoensis TaxID=208199 RepID=UPI00325B8085